MKGKTNMDLSSEESRTQMLINSIDYRHAG